MSLVTINFTNNSSPPSTNIVEAAAPLPLSSFYINSDNSLIHFKVSSSTTFSEINPSFTVGQQYITNAISTVINSTLNASSALPFNSSNYSSNYQIYPNFGRLAVGSYAHYLFGNASISYMFANREQIVSYMNGNESNDTQFATVLASTFLNLPSSVCENITEQVTNQDNTRAYNQSNFEWQGLEFKLNDIVYFTLTLSQPNINGQQGQQYVPASSNYPGIQYHIKTTLL
jgi:hypothetical protein